MPPLVITRCTVCDRLAELPYWWRFVAGRTEGGEGFSFALPLCLDCEERTRPATAQNEDQGGA